MHPEERRIAGLLRELIVQSGASLETLESRLGWEPGHLSDLLEGRLRLNFEDTLEILPLLGTTPTDFFAWLYGFEGKESVRGAEEAELAMAAGGSLAAQRSLDHRFDQSLRVVKAAIARRQVWKEERAKI
jgi:transcriptional regulator with XRE-family HTH domain